MTSKLDSLWRNAKRPCARRSPWPALGQWPLHIVHDERAGGYRQHQQAMQQPQARARRSASGALLKPCNRVCRGWWPSDAHESRHSTGREIAERHHGAFIKIEKAAAEAALNDAPAKKDKYLTAACRLFRVDELRAAAGWLSGIREMVRREGEVMSCRLCGGVLPALSRRRIRRVVSSRLDNRHFGDIILKSII